jgi:MYXO-CTERM domain-containing protein
LKKIMIAVVVAVGVTTSGGRALAGVIIAISEVGDNVVVDASGSVNLSALTRLGDGAAFADVEGGLGQVAVGSTTPGDFNVWGIASGPATFGPGGPFTASSGSGDTFGVEGSGGFVKPVLLLPTTYVSGSGLSASDTYSNTSIAALGLTPGTYTYTWGTGATADSLTVVIGSVPEPSSLAMAATAVGMLGVLALHRRRRNTR